MADEFSGGLNLKQEPFKLIATSNLAKPPYNKFALNGKFGQGDIPIADDCGIGVLQDDETVAVRHLPKGMKPILPQVLPGIMSINIGFYHGTWSTFYDYAITIMGGCPKELAAVRLTFYFSDSSSGSKTLRSSSIGEHTKKFNGDKVLVTSIGYQPIW